MVSKLATIFLISTLILAGCIEPPTNPMDEIPEGYVKVPSTTDCQKLTGNTDECFYKAALWENNTESCNSAGELKDQCFMELALNEYNQELCDLAGENKGQCIYSFALLNIDANLCEQADNYRTICYHELAVLTLNTELCKKTDTEFQLNFCTGEVEYELFLIEEDKQNDIEMQKLFKEIIKEEEEATSN